MLTFINPPKEDALIQFIVNLLYLGKVSENCCWAESFGTERKVVDLLEEHLDLVEKANVILKNGSLAIKNNRFTQSTRAFKECEGYEDLINIFKNNPSDGDFSSDCRKLLDKVSAEFEIYPEAI
jgi:hypothetical protein